MGNFPSFEVVGRGSETQPKADENFNLALWGLKHRLEPSVHIPQVTIVITNYSIVLSI